MRISWGTAMDRTPTPRMPLPSGWRSRTSRKRDLLSLSRRIKVGLVLLRQYLTLSVRPSVFLSHFSPLSNTFERGQPLPRSIHIYSCWSAPSLVRLTKLFDPLAPDVNDHPVCQPGPNRFLTFLPTPSRWTVLLHDCLSVYPQVGRQETASPAKFPRVLTW